MPTNIRVSEDGRTIESQLTDIRAVLPDTRVVTDTRALFERPNELKHGKILIQEFDIDDSLSPDIAGIRARTSTPVQINTGESQITEIFFRTRYDAPVGVVLRSPDGTITWDIYDPLADGGVRGFTVEQGWMMQILVGEGSELMFYDYWSPRGFSEPVLGGDPEECYGQKALKEVDEKTDVPSEFRAVRDPLQVLIDQHARIRREHYIADRSREVNRPVAHEDVIAEYRKVDRLVEQLFPNGEAVRFWNDGRPVRHRRTFEQVRQECLARVQSLIDEGKTADALIHVNYSRVNRGMPLVSDVSQALTDFNLDLMAREEMEDREKYEVKLRRRVPDEVALRLLDTLIAMGALPRGSNFHSLHVDVWTDNRTATRYVEVAGHTGMDYQGYPVASSHLMTAGRLGREFIFTIIRNPSDVYQRIKVGKAPSWIWTTSLGGKSADIAADELSRFYSEVTRINEEMGRKCFEGRFVEGDLEVLDAVRELLRLYAYRMRAEEGVQIRDEY